jgi:uncharacterized protein YbjT (DUF2867 family)
MGGDTLRRPVLVVGTGDLGRRVIRKLIERGAREVRAFSRHPRGPEGARLVPGDVTDPEGVLAAMEGVGGVVIAVESAYSDDDLNGPERVHHGGTRNVVAAAGDGAHVVLITQIYVTRPRTAPGMASIIAARRRAEAAVRDSGLPYTIVRPGWLTNDPGRQRGVRLEQGDTGEGRVSREDVAEVCVQALLYEEARDKTFEVYNGTDEPPSDWASLFAALKADWQGGRRGGR